MKSVTWLFAFLCWSAVAPILCAQEIQVNRENRVISVTATGTIEVEPEIAVVQIGYHNYGRARDSAYEENKDAAAKIIEALLAAGIKKGDIETNSVQLGPVDSPDGDWTSEQRTERQFEADEKWNVQVLPAQAQKVVDQAVAAGANEVQDVNWSVTNPAALDANATDAALAKARALAAQIAQQFGGKVGELLYVSNAGGNQMDRSVLYEEQVQSIPPHSQNLNLFPQKVDREVTVYAVFALE